MNTVKSVRLCYLEKSVEIVGVDLTTESGDSSESMLSSSGIVMLIIAELIVSGNQHGG